MYKPMTNWRSGTPCPQCGDTNTVCSYRDEGGPDYLDVYRLHCAKCGKELDCYAEYDYCGEGKSTCPFCSKSYRDYQGVPALFKY